MKNFFSAFRFFLVFILFSGISFAESLPKNMILNSKLGILDLKVPQNDGFYSQNNLQILELKFSQANWWQLLTANYKSKVEIPADLIYNGKTYKGVGVRFRGNTSYQMVQGQKKSFRISVDFIDSNQSLDGYKTIKLNNCHEDASFMKEVLYCNSANKTIPSARANFVKLIINGENWGIYANIQQLNKDFYEEWFFSNDGVNWRAEQLNPGPPGPGGTGFGAGLCSLNYLGADSSLYPKYYQIKYNDISNPWSTLQLATYKMDKLTFDLLYDSLQYFINVDRSLWHIANENLFTDDDSYVSKGGMDYYVFFDKETGRVQPIEYDGNTTFLSNRASQTPFLKEFDTKFPLINKLLSNSYLRARYVAHIRTIMNRYLNPNKISELVDSYNQIINQEVQNDTKKLYTYDKYITGQTSLKNFAKTRINYLNTLPEISAKGPEIKDVTYFGDNGTNASPSPEANVRISALINHQEGIEEVYLYWGTGLSGTFHRIPMYDTGRDGDLVSGDNFYTAMIPAQQSGIYVRYYIEAFAANSFNSAAYSPEEAEHNVHFYQVMPKVNSNSDIVINELMASNQTTITDPDGGYADWIELYNKSQNEVDLSGKYLSDRADNIKKWQFPAGTKIAGNGYLLVWADEDEEQSGLHSNFKLGAEGEVLILADDDANKNAILDIIEFGTQKTDVSFGRLPNGTGEFTFLSPTPGAVNTTVGIQEIGADDLKIYPNPASSYLQISGLKGGEFFELFDGLGRLITSGTTWGTIYLADIEPGSYLLRFQNLTFRLSVIR